MGRTDMGECGSWRASNWTVQWMIGGNGDSWDMSDHLSPRDEALTNALSDYMLGTIIPNSEALAIWPDVQPYTLQRVRSEMWWTAWQRKSSVTKFVAITAGFVVIGIVVACVVVPRGKVKTA